MKKHQERYDWNAGTVSAACTGVVIAIGSWFKWRQTPWRTVDCKRCLRQKPAQPRDCDCMSLTGCRWCSDEKPAQPRSESSDG